MSSKQQLAVVETTGNISVRAVYQELWSLRKSIPVWSCALYVSFSIWFIAMVLIFILGWAIGRSLPRAFEELIAGRLTLTAEIVNVFTLFLLLVAVLPVTTWGTTRLLVNLVDGTGKFSDLFDLLRLSDQTDSDRVAWPTRTWTRIGKFFLFQLVFTILLYGLLGIMILTRILMLENPLIAVCGYVLRVWILSVGIRFLFVYFFMVDRGCEGTEALKQSWRATKNQWIQIMTLMFIPLVSTLIALLLVAIVWSWSGLGGNVLYSVIYGSVLVLVSITSLTIGIAYRQVVPKRLYSARGPF